MYDREDRTGKLDYLKKGAGHNFLHKTPNFVKIVILYATINAYKRRNFDVS